jgi:hypothetical protein
VAVAEIVPDTHPSSSENDNAERGSEAAPRMSDAVKDPYIFLMK